MENATHCGHKGRSRIVGGEATAEGEIPWQCALLKSDNSWAGCGAVLLSCEPTIVLSAAHCFPRASAQGMKVSCGNHEMNFNEDRKLGDFEKVLEIEELILHENYDSWTSANDIAILKVKGNLRCKRQHIWPACIPCNHQYTDWGLDHIGQHQGLVTGWGTVSEGGYVSEVLRKVRVPVRSDAECEKYLGDIDEDTMICAGAEGKDSCQGDSGGPLVVHDDVNEPDQGWALVGLVSWGRGCARKDLYGVYTEVSHFIPWIAYKMGMLPPSEYMS